MKKYFPFILLLLALKGMTQDSMQLKNSGFNITGFAEAYYSFDFNKPSNNTRPPFLYSHNRHNEFNINLAYIKGSYNADRTRGNVALGVGTYMNANYASEPGVLKNIYEANVGVKLSSKKDLWLDAGVLPSHIGFESAKSSDCWTLTRSILAENSPYYEGGARISYSSVNTKWYLSVLALNGWQRITRVDANSLMSWGTQVTFRPSAKTLLNYSTFLGTDKPDSSRQWRYFHNTYGIFQLTSKFGMTLGFDFGQEQKAKGNDRKNTWFSPIIILRLVPYQNWAVAMRAEYYSDKHGVVIPVTSPNGFRTFGISFNVDRNVSENFLWRLEFRSLNSSDNLFVKNNNFVKANSAITTSLALNF